MSRTIRELIEEAKGEFEDLRQIHDGERAHSAAAVKKKAKEIAEQYLSGGLGVLKELGAPMTAAIFVALGHEGIQWDKEGQKMVYDSERETEEEAVELVEWLIKNGRLNIGTTLKPLFQRLLKEEQYFLALSVFLAAKLLKEEKK